MDNRIYVWTYWHTEDRPAVVNECIASWKKHIDPDKFKIIVLSEKSVHQYLSPEWLEQIPDFKCLDIANQADFIRLSLLKFYGGVWMDASIYLLQDFSFIENFDKFYGPRFPFVDYQNVQVFFLVAPKDHDTINKWLGLYTHVLQKKLKIRNRWYRLSLYSGIVLRVLISHDEKFRTYLQVYESYAELHRSDAVFRRNTPGFSEYGAKARFRKENFLKILKSVTLLALVRLAERVVPNRVPSSLANSHTNEFDPEFYLQHYPDVRFSGDDPYDHYVTHGRAEGRLQRAPLIGALAARKLQTLNNRLRAIVTAIWKQEQYPSITLSRNGKIIFCKLNALDRKFLASDFRFEQEPD